MSTLRNAVGRRRGMVLIIVLSVLAVMAILGISLLTLNALDRTVTDNHLHQVQARLTARSGVEDAMARLRDGAVLLKAFDTENDWLYRGNDVSGQDPTKRAEPVAWAQRPSFQKKALNGNPETVEIWRDDTKSTVTVGVSGTSPGRFHDRSNVYSLQVRDLSSCIYINDGVHLYGGNNSSVSQNLKRILNRLGEQPQVGVSNLGTLVIANRPVTGYSSWQDFKSIMKTKAGMQEIQLDRMERFLTAVAWVDKNVVNPVPLSMSVLAHYPVKYERGDEDNAVFRRGPGKDFENKDRSKDERLGWLPDFGGMTGLGGLTTKVYGLDELNPTYVEVVHRAPVNVNTAEEAVLIALLSDLKGFYLLEKRSAHPFGADIPGAYVYNYNYPDMLAANTDLPDGKQKTASVGRGWFTWENMGHTYSRQPWKARVEATESYEYWKSMGGTSASTVASMNFESVADHDDIGELWITPTIAAGDSTGTVAGGISAKSIAQEMIACRGRTGRYAGAAFGGPFKSWAQFYAFCDNLVTVRKDGGAGFGVLRDDRFTRPDERRQAEQAMADMLKANFNPNFTPNEVNPDHNLFLMVDKTDLVVNSTEFCFLPTGLFSISSAGRVLRDMRTGREVRKDARDTGVGPQEIVAQSRLDAVVLAYESYRETSQRHFYLGDATPAADPSYTNNALTVETGPEPDNGPLLYNEHLGHEAPFQRLTTELDGYNGDTAARGEVMSGWGYEASGYMGLPTRGGLQSVKRKGDIQKPVLGFPLTQWDTVSGLTLNPLLRGSFRLNDTLDYSKAAQVLQQPVYMVNVASTVLSKAGSDPAQGWISEYVYNPATCSGQVVRRRIGGSLGSPLIEQASDFPDPGEEQAQAGTPMLSPYDATDASRYRLVRSVRLPLSSHAPGATAGTVSDPVSGGTQSLPRMVKAAPSDLRVDGYYSERHSGLAYWIEEPKTAADESFKTASGTAAFWFKPSFDPGYTGKVRSIASVSRYHRKNFYYRNPSPFTLYFMPAFASSANPSVTFEPGGVANSNGKSFTVSNQAFGYLPVTGGTAISPAYEGLTAIQRASLVFQISYSSFDGSGWGFEYQAANANQADKKSPLSPGRWSEMERYWATSTMNDKAIDMPEKDTNGLRAHHWTHLAMSWKLDRTNAAGSNAWLKVLVNGLAIYGDGSPTGYTAGFAPTQSGFVDASAAAAQDRKPRFSDQDFFDHSPSNDTGGTDERWHFAGDRWEDPSESYIVNTFRLGEVSTHSFRPESFCRNFSSDGTYDEFYLWKDTDPDNMGGTSVAAAAIPGNLPAQKFAQGRYYVPSGVGEDATWTSPELTLKRRLDTRELASPRGGTMTGAPGIMAEKPTGVGMTTTGGSRSTVRLLGVSWTWLAEKYASGSAGETLGGHPTLIPIMVDYQDAKGPEDLKQEKACARISVLVDGIKYPMNDSEGLSNDAFSPIQDHSGGPVSLGEAGKFKYQVKFVIEGATHDSVLLSSPILDDVTFYYLTPGSSFLQYVESAEIQ